ncbi:MAG: CRISPR-associated endonuclease Cas1 [Thermodesulfobacteriota bacterium]|nr:CRISPR-associated endonuclease Cas1 [Thermodesulfobacteriota bacterium]
MWGAAGNRGLYLEIRKDGDQLVVYMSDGTKKALPGKMIFAFVLDGNVQISSQCIHFCAANNIGVHWFSYGGRHVGAFSEGAGAVQRKNRQFQALQDPLLKARLSEPLCQGKFENQVRYLLRLTRVTKEHKRSPEVGKGLESMRTELKQLAKLNEIME